MTLPINSYRRNLLVICVIFYTKKNSLDYANPLSLQDEFAGMLEQNNANILGIEQLSAKNNAYQITTANITEQEARDITEQLIANDDKFAKTDYAICQIAPPISTSPNQTSSAIITQQEVQKTLRKKLLISDMDSTIIKQECIDEIASALGIKDKIAKITAEAMAGRLDFQDSLKQRVRLLKGVTEGDLHKIASQKIELTAGAKELLAVMNRNGATAILVSGGFSFFTEKIAKLAGFKEHFANHLEFDRVIDKAIDNSGDSKEAFDGATSSRADSSHSSSYSAVLTGFLHPPILDENSKLEILLEKIAQLNIDPSDVLAVGDGANDIKMLKYTEINHGLGIGFHPKEFLANNLNYHIRHGNLRSLLYFQGYKDEDIYL